MHNHACVVITGADVRSSATYLPLNGGPEWVAAFLNAPERHDARVDSGGPDHPREGRVACAAPSSLRTIHDGMGGGR